MYIPHIDLETDQKEILEFMKLYSFAEIITAKNNLPIATHLPFVVTVNNDKIVLTSHFAKANMQWKDIEHNNNLIIFSGPHAYISPKNYEKVVEVPTWNYVAVHAYGKGKLVTETEKVFRILEASIDYFEESYRQQWQNLPGDFKMNMLKGIIAFEITVTDLQAKKKLSKNKSLVEQENIIKILSESNNSNEKEVACYMIKNRTSQNRD